MFSYIKEAGESVLIKGASQRTLYRLLVALITGFLESIDSTQPAGYGPHGIPALIFTVHFAALTNPITLKGN